LIFISLQSFSKSLDKVDTENLLSTRVITSQWVVLLFGLAFRRDYRLDLDLFQPKKEVIFFIWTWRSPRPKLI